MKKLYHFWIKDGRAKISYQIVMPATNYQSALKNVKSVVGNHEDFTANDVKIEFQFSE